MTALLSRLERRPVKLATKPDPLHEVLDRLGIPPFDGESVLRYKNAMKKELKGRLVFSRWLVVFILLTLLGICAICAFSATIGIVQMRYIVAGCLMILVAVATMVRWGINPLLLEIDWLRCPLHCYQRQIPEFVQQTINDVKVACPRTTFEIDEIALYDPFLVVYHEGAVYYIEVWNEPDFKQKRIR